MMNLDPFCTVSGSCCDALLGQDLSAWPTRRRAGFISLGRKSTAEYSEPDAATDLQRVHIGHGTQSEWDQNVLDHYQLQELFEY